MATEQARCSNPWLGWPMGLEPTTPTSLIRHQLYRAKECMVQIEFNGPIWFWKGPAPWYFVTIPEAQSSAIKAIAGLVTYGWGVIPVQARIGQTAWRTSLIPKDGRYLVPLKASVRQAEQLAEGDAVAITVHVGP